MIEGGELLRAQREVVSGVPVYWVDAPGPVRAALVFRAGWVDEALPQRGVTHLIEHLALSAVPRSSFDFNGMVDETKTVFSCSGTAAEAVGFLETVARNLSNLPIDRLEAEKRILQVEGDARQRSSVDALRTWRFGAKGPGAGSYDEFALRWMGPETVKKWVRTAFTSGNAAVWMTCRPPTNFELHLPPGAELPIHRVPTTVEDGPRFITGGSHGLAASFLVPRSVDSAVLEWLLQRRLFERLRTQDAISYSIDVGRRAVDDRSNELFVFVDGLPESQAQLEAGVLDVIDELATTNCTSAELQEWRTRYLEPLSQPDSIPGLLHLMVTDHLYGLPTMQTDDLVREVDRVTSETVRAVLVDGRSSLLYRVPADSAAIGARFRALSDWSPVAISGRRFRSTNPNSGASLLVGDQGVSYEIDAERRITVLWPDCAAMLRWDDGGRRLLGADGNVIDLPPQAWRDFPALLTEIDRRTRTDVVVHMGEAPARPPAPLPRSRVLGGFSTSMVVVLTVAMALCAFLLASAGLRAFLYAGIPLLIAAGFSSREVYLRKRQRRSGGTGTVALGSRPMRHISRSTLWLALTLSATFATVLAAAAAKGATVGPLPVLFGVIGLSALRELLRRPNRQHSSR